jgi:hypothetical protein
VLRCSHSLLLLLLLLVYLVAERSHYAMWQMIFRLKTY